MVWFGRTLFCFVFCVSGRASVFLIGSRIACTRLLLESVHFVFWRCRFYERRLVQSSFFRNRPTVRLHAHCIFEQPCPMYSRCTRRVRDYQKDASRLNRPMSTGRTYQHERSSEIRQPGTRSYHDVLSGAHLDPADLDENRVRDPYHI
jgi:hypothetical protein